MQPTSSVWQKVKDFPKISKILFSFAFVILLTVPLILVLYNRGQKATVVQKPTPEKWEKLALDAQYSPLYVLSPKTNRKFGIVSQEVFSLKTKDPAEANFIKNNLITSKPVDITQKGTNDFEIIPTKPLDADETISMKMKNNENYSWIFQAAPKLKIAETLPRDKATNVPINAGIEFTFNSDTYDLQNSNITISPNVNFRLEKHDQKLAMIPLTPLQPKTLYQITLKKNDLTSTFSFQTGDVDLGKSRLSLAKDFQEVFPDEELLTKVNAANFDSNQVVSTKVYKFPNVDTFIASRSNLDKIKSTWSSYYGENDLVNTNNLSKVLTADLKIQTQGQNQQLQYLQLPQNLDEGFYLVQFWFDNGTKVEQLWVESSSTPGYISVGKLQTVVWINSAKSEDVGSSEVRILGTDSTFSTNNEGWAAFPTPQLFFDSKERHYILITTTLGRKLVIPVDNLSGRSKPNDTVSDDYWSYLYQERLLYKPNDTVYFWGVAKNKDTGSPASAVDIYLGETLAQTVHPEADGTYIGKIQLTNTVLGYSSITSKINGVTLNSSYFQVSDYAKPELKIEVTSNKKVIFAGEKIDYKARITFFDGTPATNMQLYISQAYSGSVDKTEITADKNGEVSFTYTSKVDSATSYPRYEDVTVSAVKSGEAPSDGVGTVYVYGSQLQIVSTSNQDQNHASLKQDLRSVKIGHKVETFCIVNI